MTRLKIDAAARGREDARAGEMFRGLLYGLPIGLAMWLLLALCVWRIA